MRFYAEPHAKSPCIAKLVEALSAKMPQIEVDRAALLFNPLFLQDVLSSHGRTFH